jgi:uncharacterized lipoprotein
MYLSLLSACAYSPQQITIDPLIASDNERYGGGREVVVSVEDSRAVKELGSRGGAYKETSLITIDNNLADAIKRAAEEKLSAQGFNVNSSAGDAASVIITIEQLTYDVPEQSVGKKVMLEAGLKVNVAAGDESYAGTYKSASERQTVVTPSMEKNEEMINSLLSDTLLRLFSDPKLKDFFSNIPM